jgi:hypothetical protein
MKARTLLFSLAGFAAYVTGGAAQSPNPFGTPSADQPTPTASIDAVAGSR